MGIAEYDSLDGLGLGALVRRGAVSPKELLEEALRRTEQVNSRINAVTRFVPEESTRALAASAGGAFSGVPFLVKDLDCAIAGVPSTAGSRYLRDYRPTRDSTLMERLRRAGLVVFGKTNTPELGLMPTTEPELFGPTRNPWDLTRTAGGSSGGAAAAVAAGIVPVAHGNDGGGSIRIPASCCGVFGLKPTRGRTPVGPDRSELWHGFAIGHVLSRTVRDSAAMLDAIAGPEPTSFHWAPPAGPFLEEVGRPPGRLRIALTRRPHTTTEPLHPDCAAAVDDAGRLLESLGHHVEEADVELDPDAFVRSFFVLVCVEMATLLALARRELGRGPRVDEIETSTAVTATLGRQRTAVEASVAREHLQAVARRVATFFADYDLLLSPTLGRPPLPLGALRPPPVERLGQALVHRFRMEALLRIPGVIDDSLRRVFSFVAFPPLANVTGQPAMSVPLFWNAAGLPVGVQLMGRFGDEASLFRVAAQLEAARPWAHRRPPVFAS